MRVFFIKGDFILLQFFLDVLYFYCSSFCGEFIITIESTWAQWPSAALTLLISNSYHVIVLYLRKMCRKMYRNYLKFKIEKV